MSKEAKIKEQLAIARGFIFALFALIVFALLKEYNGALSWIIAICSVVSIGIISMYMNKKLDELEEE
ncbi:MAG: hypothetical protein DRP93_06090 [Candidatus Neomarinimicrobiota bacterium]|nr:MAG: hypothetical protein DRP93_06090 [Candidatus Neomarinimicrobiota bacterium]